MSITEKMFLAAALMAMAQANVGAQSSGYLYHTVGPAVFTNATAWGFADGQRAGSNFICGVYAGVEVNSLTPYYGRPGSSHLRQFFPARGLAVMSGPLAAVAPVGTPILVQFRAWPAEFKSYEEAVAASTPSPPVGMSAIWQAIPDNMIVEFPIQTGTLWLTPVPEPSVLGLLALGCAGLAGRRLAADSRSVWRKQ